MDFTSEDFPVIIPPVSCMGSAHDRACEIFGYLMRTRVFYGHEHAEKHHHAVHGKDYSQESLPQGTSDLNWSAENPIHVIGHSFGGNTARVLVYLLSIDFFGFGTSRDWVRSVTTISSPLQGSLLTYALGAREDHDHPAPVQFFSPGYVIGLAAHFYSLTAPSFLKNIFDIGLDHFNLGKHGHRGFWEALKGGRNGGGTVPVCERDNAANDMTLHHAMQQNKLYQQHVEAEPSTDECPTGQRKKFYQFHFVARGRPSKDFSLLASIRKHFSVDSRDAETSRLYSAGLCFRDFAIYHLVTKVQRYSTYSTLENKLIARNVNLMLRLDESDGLCSTFTQSFSDAVSDSDYESCSNFDDASQQADESFSNNSKDMVNQDAFVLHYDTTKLKEIDFAPGKYRIDMMEHNHFSVIPFPDNFQHQEAFFSCLFHILKTLN